MRWLTLAITIFLFGLNFSPLAEASTASSGPVSTGWLQHPDHPPVEVRLSLTGVAYADSKQVQGLLEVRLHGDWKTYWRSPGEGGIAPMAHWQASQNLSHVDWQWPTPQRYEVSGVETVGYKANVAFPLSFHVNNWQQPVSVQGQLTMSSCTDICVLTDYDIKLAFVPSQLEPNDNIHFLFQQALSQVPSKLSASSTESMSVKEAIWSAYSNQLYIRLQAPTHFINPDVFVDSLVTDIRDITVKRPDIHFNKNELELTVDVEHWLGDLDLTDQPIQLSIVDEQFAYELQVKPKGGTVPASLAASNHSGEPLSWGALVLFSLLGGFILNIMPCVLPVLGMKLQSVLTENRQQSVVRKQFLSSAAGIVVSFWLIAAGLLALKFSGSAIGWGIQFQSPYFLGFMVVVTWLFTLNLAGIFSIRLPSNMGTWAATKGDQSMGGHFVQGMFATLLATPCSAPFLGTAIGFALAASALQMLAIFTLLGIGMALPWILVAAQPRLAGLLPKPGHWMNITKVVFSFMLAATTVWLMFLLRSHIDLVIWRVIFSVVTVLSSILVWRTYGSKGLAISVAFGFLSLFAAVFFAVLTADDLNEQPNWQVLNVDRINQEVAVGKVVFVDITAKWCITCKANEVGVLLQNPVYTALQASDVVLMQGDWTVPNDYVTTYLKSHNRFGVPFNIVYGPGAPKGIELPVILTNQAVIDALEKAR